MHLLEFMMGLDIYYYFDLKNMILFPIGLDILYVQKVVLLMLFLITMQKSKLIHTILCP